MVWRLAAIHIVPPIAGKFLLIEQGSIGAQECRSLISLATVVAHVVHLVFCFFFLINKWK